MLQSPFYCKKVGKDLKSKIHIPIGARQVIEMMEVSWAWYSKALQVRDGDIVYIYSIEGLLANF